MGRTGIISVFVLWLMAFWGSTTLAQLVIDANAPGGTHFVTGTPNPTCSTVGLTATCPVSAFELAGVGHNDATATLTATYGAIVDCFNPGVNPQNPIESHTQTTDTSTSSGLLEPKNGRLTINPLTVEPPTEAEFQELASCPNPNWDAKVRPGSVTLAGFTFTVDFVGFSGPYITITGP
jgi:hypothetical protein